MKKILIATPTSQYKDYCVEKWVDNIVVICKNYDNSLKNIGVAIIDNSQHINHSWYIKELFLKKEPKLFCDVIHHYTKKELRELMCDCNNIISQLVFKYKADYLVSVESDLFPKHDIVNKLIENIEKTGNNSVVGMPYFLNKLHKSYPVILELEDFGDHRLLNPVVAEYTFDKISGQLEEVNQLGLGCCIIPKNVLKKVPFRIDTSDKMHTCADTFFYMDCAKKGIKIYCDTSTWIHHQNGSWKKVMKEQEKSHNV